MAKIQVGWLTGARHGAVAVALAAGIALAGCTEEAPKPPPPRAVRVIEVNPQQAVLTAQGAGRIEARNTANVGFLVAGRLVQRAVDVGAEVKSGDLIARIDDTDFQSKVVAAQSQVTAAQAAVAQAAPQEARIAELLAKGFATREQYEAALSALNSAKAQLQGAEANLKLAQDQLKYTQLLAPTGGVVTATGADVGQVVAAGQMIAQIAQHGEREGVFSVAPEQVSYAFVGMPVKVWLQDKPTEIVNGSVREIAPNADPVTGAFQVKVALPNAPDDMRLGAIVVGRAEVDGGGTIVRIPSTALIQTSGDPQVWTVSADNVVSRHPIKVLRYDTDSVVVQSGLKKGDLVVIAGVNSLAEGQKVALQKVAQQ